MGTDVVVIGAGGFGREILDVLEAHNANSRDGHFHVLGILDDAPSEIDCDRLQRRGYRHLGDLSKLKELNEEVRYFIGIGDPVTRTEIAGHCETMGLTAGIAIHPSASIGSDVKISAGTVVCGGVQVSTNVTLGKHAHLNPASVIGHDAVIGDCCSINPAATLSGEVRLDEQVLIGAGAVVLQGLAIGAGSTVGASACVTRDILPGQVVLGVPAREKQVVG